MMKEILIRLPDRIYDLLASAAAKSGARPEDYATDILVDALVDAQSGNPESRQVSVSEPTLSGRNPQGVAPHRTAMPFTCQGQFPGASPYSIQWAQRFVDAALSYNGVQASVHEGGVAFNPNFVFIERVYTNMDGFAASFYGSVGEFARYNLNVEPGRNESYSRVKVRSPHDLGIALDCIKVSARGRNLQLGENQ